MKQTDLVKIIADGTGSTKVQAKAVYDKLKETITDEIVNGTVIYGIGSFKLMEKPAYTFKSGLDKKEYTVDEHTQLKFKPSKSIKETLNK